MPNLRIRNMTLRQFSTSYHFWFNLGDSTRPNEAWYQNDHSSSIHQGDIWIIVISLESSLPQNVENRTKLLWSDSPRKAQWRYRSRSSLFHRKFWNRLGRWKTFNKLSCQSPKCFKLHYHISLLLVFLNIKTNTDHLNRI